MNTPVYDYLISYAESGTLRMHMPGHKGKKTNNELSDVFRLDLTEITDAGNLFSDEGIIAESHVLFHGRFDPVYTDHAGSGKTRGQESYRCPECSPCVSKRMHAS